MAETGDLTVRIRAIDEASPVIRGIASELTELEIKRDAWPVIAATLGAANLGLLLIILLKLGGAL